MSFVRLNIVHDSRYRRIILGVLLTAIAAIITFVKIINFDKAMLGNTGLSTLMIAAFILRLSAICILLYITFQLRYRTPLLIIAIAVSVILVQNILELYHNSYQNKSTSMEEAILFFLSSFFLLAGLLFAKPLLKEYRNFTTAIERSNKRFHDIFEKNIAVKLIIHPATGRIVDANAAACKFYGYSRDVLLNMKISEINTLSEKEVFEEMQKAAAMKKIYFNFRHRLADGTIRDVEVYSSPFETEEGTMLNSIVHDVTEKIRSQRELKEREERYRAMMETSRDFIHIVDDDCNLLEANSAFVKHLGYSEAETKKLKIYDWDSRWNDKELSEQVRSLVNQEGIFETVHRRKDGTLVPVEINANRIEINGKACLYCTGRNVAHQRMLQEELNKTIALYQSLVNSLPFNLYRIDTEGKLTFVNETLLKSIGGTVNDVVGKTAYDFYPIEHAAKYRADDQHVVMSKSNFSTQEENINPLTGEKSLVRVIKIPIQDHNGVVTGIQGVFWDVTDEKKNEERMRLLSSALEAAANGIVITDFTGKIEWVNPAFEKISGYTFREALGKNPRELINSGKHDTEFFKTMWDTITSGKVWVGEITNKRKDGTIYYEEQTITPVIDDKGIITHYIGIKQNISEQKIMSGKLKEQTDALQLILDNSPIGIWLLTKDGRLRFVNKTFCAAVGISEEKFKTVNHYSQVYDERTAKTCLESDAVAFSQPGAHVSYEQLLFVDGKIHDLEITKSQITDANGNTTGLLGVAQDITERKKSEKNLKDRERSMQALALSVFELLRMTNQTMDSAILEAIRILGEEIHVDRVYIFENHIDETTKHIISYQKYEWCRREVQSQIKHYEDNPSQLGKNLPRWAAILGNGEPIRTIVNELPVDEQKIFLAQDIKSLIVVPIMLKGKFWGFLGFDDTHTERIWTDDEESILKIAAASFGNAIERRRIEKELRSSEQRYRATFEQAAVGIVQTTLGGVFTKVNRAMCEFLGYSTEELLKKSFPEVTVEGDLEKDREKLHSMLKGTIDSFTTEKRYVCKNGAVVWGNVTLSLVRNSNFQPEYVVGVIENITSKKIVEQSLQKLAVTTGSYNNDSIFDLIAKNLSETLHVRYAFIGEMLPERDAIRTLSFYSNGFKQENIVYQIKNTPCEQVLRNNFIINYSQQVREKFPNDPPLRVMGVEAYAGMSLIDSEGITRGIIVIMHDQQFELTPKIESILTLYGYRASNEMEKAFIGNALRESEERYQGLIQSAIDGYWVVSGEGKLLQVNDAYCTMTGYAREELLTMNASDLISTEHEQWFSHHMNQARIYGYDKDEIKHRCSDGKYIDVLISTVYLEHQDVFLVFISNITSQKEAERSLRESEKRYRLLAENSSDVIWIMNFDGTFNYISPSIEQMRGFTPFELLHIPIEYHVTEASLPTIQQFIEKIQYVLRGNEQSEPEVFQIEQNRKDGSTIWVEVTARVLYDNNKPIGILGISRDISQRKEAEQKLQNSEEQYRLLVENGTESIFVVQDGILKFANKMTELKLELPNEQIIGRQVLDFMPSEHRSEIKRRYALLVTGRIHTDLRTYKIVLANSSTYWAEVNSVRIMWEGRPATLNFAIDVTKRLEAEQLLKFSEETYRKLINSINEAIYIQDENGIFIDINHAVELMYGYDRSHFIGKTLEDFSSSVLSNSPDISEKLNKAFNGDPQIFEYFGRRRDGNIFPSEISLTAGFYFGRKVIIGVARDISDRKLSEEISLTRYRLGEYSKNHTMKDLLQRTVDDAEMLTHSSIGFFHFIDIEKNIVELQAWSTKTKDTMCHITNGEEHYSIDNAGAWSECIYTKQPVIHNDYEHLINKRELPEGHAEILREVTVPILRNNKVVAILGVGNKKIDYNDQDVDILYQLASLAWDIVMRKKAEDALYESEQRWRYALEGAGDGVWEWNKGTDRIYRSRRWKEMLGYSENEVTDTFEEWDRLVHPHDLSILKTEFQAHQNSKKHKYSIEYRMLCKDGTYKWILDRAMVMERTDDGTPLRIIGTHADITDIKKIHEQIRELNENLELKVEERTRQLQEANKQLESFAYSVSHDLRAPLRAIDSFSKILLDEELERLSMDGKRQLSMIRTNTSRMGRLIDDLLEFSRMNRAEIKKILFAIEAFSTSIVNDLKNSEVNRHITVTIRPLPKAFGDPSLIRQVLTNLIGNAFKFTKHREIAEIEIGGVESDHDTSYYIKDNGAGFDMRYADKIFGVFQRLHAQQEYEGTGVGLAIVHRIIQRHGGSIQAYGEVGNGAIFTFTLPKQHMQIN